MTLSLTKHFHITVHYTMRFQSILKLKDWFHKDIVYHTIKIVLTFRILSSTSLRVREILFFNPVRPQPAAQHIVPGLAKSEGAGRGTTSTAEVKLACFLS